ncbi:aldehyde oxidoreductase molybdenum-binding subunit PaoC [Variovorax saccharolyticus]|uniref:aldehyde oxidoreductase molybdenum-binding subunit PaoC n=1 Tax=Variovorax saccharolyticus TaxID=3053516 RepID=UPI0025786B1D|nr:aldehyde oxidoreductase molybdenum-binding subunit PaoC [Variovorax sp. J22R187]MDM0022199.1 aldehyde oxidoreductase molybdenum-binding subunit PaoC [Variovorax sp. J22R187]
MKFDTPATNNPIDQLRVVGKPVDRVEGVLKVTGTARYAFENHDVVPNQAYGCIVASGIAKGRVESMDLAAASEAPGVIAIVTAKNAGPVGVGDFYVAKALGGPEIQHYHQAVAVVVATTFEQARAASKLVRVAYSRSEDGAYDLSSARTSTIVPRNNPDSGAGDFAAAFASAPVQVDQTYTTPDQTHAMMEPHATVAAWDGDRLTIWTSVQIIKWALRDMAKILGIPKEKIRIISPYIGGGFGGKASVLSDAVLAALAAREAGRPVKVALARPEMINNTSHRPATIQRVRLGADRDGRITAIGHESWSGNLAGGAAERATLPTVSLYAGANRMLRLRLATLDLPEGNAMRAPGETPGMMALEIAMDELAEQLKIDPVQLRLLNDTQTEPAPPHRQFSTRRLADCLRTGAERFNWSRRAAQPGQLRDGQWLIGMGMACAIRGDNVTDSGARVRLGVDGKLTVETDMTDLGTGTYTILAQTAAEMMGLPLEHVSVRLGDSSFPEAPGSLGQRGANSSTSGVYAACVKLRELVAKRLGFDNQPLDFKDGEVSSSSRRAPLLRAVALGELVAEDRVEFGASRDRLAHQTFGTHFVEVGVSASTGEVRVRRMLSVCAAGRILNPKTARSQVIGAMTMGVGGALMEELSIDKRHGFFVNHDLASYEVPVHADIPVQEVIFIDETDPTSSPMKAKGVGELGICGVGAAIANAVYNATGTRIRDYPLTLDKLVGNLPPPM